MLLIFYFSRWLQSISRRSEAKLMIDWVLQPFLIAQGMCYPWVISSVPMSHILGTCDAVLVSHILSTCEDMQYLWVISSVPVSHILSTREDMQYLWVISSVPVCHILSTHEDMQYPWVISSVPMSLILTAHEDMQYPWFISSVPMSHILSTHEDMQYPWVNLYEWRMNETSLMGNAYSHWYCIFSRVLHILMGTEDMTHGYWGYDSQQEKITRRVNLKLQLYLWYAPENSIFCNIYF